MERPLKRLALAALLFSAAPLWADDEGVGRGAAAYMGLGVGARAIGMGGAYAAQADGADALYWNPALLARAKSASVSVGSTKLDDDRDYHYAVAAIAFRRDRKENDWDFGFEADSSPSDRTYFRPSDDGRRYGVAVGILTLGMPEFDRYDDFGNAAGTFEDEEQALMFGMGMSVYQDLWVGLGVDMMTQKIDDAKADGVGISFGALWITPGESWRESWRVAAAVRSMGAQLNWKVPYTPTGETFRYPEEVPMRASLGVSKSLMGKRLTVAVEGRHVADQDVQPHAGLEFKPLPIFALRAGLNHEDPTAGFGLRLPAGALSLQLDYAYQQDVDDYYSPHWLTVSLAWGE